MTYNTLMLPVRMQPAFPWRQHGNPMKAALFGPESDALRPVLAKYGEIEIVEAEPDVVICYGGDGTLLRAERQWPGIPKAPIRNSTRGNRCIARPPDEVITRLLRNELVRNEYLKVQCDIVRADSKAHLPTVTAINEVNVHMGRINAAVRFRIWIDGDPFADGEEIIGDGFVISTPFGSSAYFNQITRGIFYTGIGIGLKNAWAQTTHVIVSDNAEIRVAISRGPGLLGYDNASEVIKLRQGDELVAKRHPQPAVLYTWSSMTHPSDQF